MIFLQVIWMTAAVLIALSLLLWMTLLFVHAFAMRHDRRVEAYSEAWLERLLDVMDGDKSPDVLPMPKSVEETVAVISLLRDLTERFSGSYNERMVLVLNQIKAVEYGLKLLRSRSMNKKVSGCALLAWCGESEAVDACLVNTLKSSDSRVVLEAASALVRRNKVHDIVQIVHALCRGRAAKSLLARDLFRRWGERETSDWSELLKSDWTDDGWVLLLEAAGASNRGDWTHLIAKQVNHSSPLVVRIALLALENLGDPNGVNAAIEACKHQDEQVRYQAVKTLSACGNLTQAYPAMEKLLVDNSFEVRRSALQGIINFGGRLHLKEMMPVDDWQRELFKEVGLQMKQ